MYLQYGNYVHDLGEVTLSITRNEVIAENGQAVGYTERWDIQGTIVEDDHAAMATKITALTNAYAKQGMNAFFIATDRSTILHRMLSSATVGGVRSTPPSFPFQESQGLYATNLKYTIVLQAEFATALQNGLVSWRETLAWSGGGPRRIWRQPLQGPPILQITATNTPYVMTQSGSAVGRYQYPTPPGPLHPSLLWRLPEYRQISPEFRGGKWLNFGVEWNYEHQSTNPIAGVPSLPL